MVNNIQAYNHTVSFLHPDSTLCYITKKFIVEF